MTFPKKIKEKLKKCPLEIQVFIKELQADHNKVARKNAKLYSQNLLCKDRIAILEKQIKIQAHEIAKLSKKTTIKVIYDD